MHVMSPLLLIPFLEDAIFPDFTGNAVALQSFAFNEKVILFDIQNISPHSTVFVFQVRLLVRLNPTAGGRGQMTPWLTSGECKRPLLWRAVSPPDQPPPSSPPAVP